MPSIGSFLQTYVNNKHNLLFITLVLLAITISFIPEIVLHNAKEELLKTIIPNANTGSSSSHSNNDRATHNKQSIFPSFFPNHHLHHASSSGRNLSKEFAQYQSQVQEYERLKSSIASLSETMAKIEFAQLALTQQPTTTTTTSADSTTNDDGANDAAPVISPFQEKLQTQYQAMIQRQTQLSTLLHQAKDYQILQITQTVELQENVTLFTEQHQAEKEYLERHLLRLQEKIHHYQMVLDTTHQRNQFYIQLNTKNQFLSKTLLDTMSKVRQVMSYDERLCKDRINLLKRHQVKFQKDEFEQLIKSTVNEKLQAYAYLQDAHSNANQSPPTPTPPPNNANQQHQQDTSYCHATGAQLKVQQEKPDYALLTAGAEVVLKETTLTYVPYELQIKNTLSQVAHSLGLEDYSDYIPQFDTSHTWTEAVGLFYGVGSVQDVLRPDMRLGNCWPMNGTNGFFTVKLKDPIFLESISIDHIGKSEARDWRTAPKDFRVYASLDLSRGWREVLRETFEPNRTTASHNYLLPNTDEENYGPVQYVKLNILSNHGNPEYTCIYRFRVHGEVI